MSPRPKKPSQKQSSRLLEAVKFLAQLAKDTGAPRDTHILLQNKTATIFVDPIGAGTLIDEDLVAAPHAKTFLNALSKCGENYTLTQIDQHRLSIKSGPFKANIPCVDPTLLFFPTPNTMQGTITDEFKSALTTIEKIKPENGQRLLTLSFLMNGQSIISTDGKIIVEAWHGLNLPTNLPIPKTVIPLLQINKKLISFGFDNMTATFFFEDNSFVRTQLYAEQWPDIMSIFDKVVNPLPLLKDFYKGVETVQEFSHNGFIHFKDGKLLSEDVEEKGASFDVEGLRGGPVYSAKYLMMLKDVIQEADFYVPAERKSLLCYFTGKNIRGILMGYG